MANLTTTEKQILENTFQMSGGSVLNFTNRTMAEFFFDDLGIEIYNEKYNYASGSKANYMRGFWQAADNKLVGKSIKKIIEYIENQILMGKLERSSFNPNLVDNCIKIASKLMGESIEEQKNEIKEDELIKRDFKDISIAKLGLDSIVTMALQERVVEIRKCLEVKASLAVIFLCGSSLEGILLGIASKNPKLFNTANASPIDKTTGKVKHFQNWTLSNFIDVASELKFIGEDVKKFSHAMRDFRNYIHPYEQISSGFSPDEHTAKICSQVLLAAISQLSK